MEEESIFSKFTKNRTFNFEEFPVPPIPKDYKSKSKVFVPPGMDDMIEKYLFEAQHLTRNEHFEEAKKLYLKASKLSPYDSGIWRNLGNIYYSQNQYLEAFNCFQGFLFHNENESHDPQFWFTVGVVYQKLDLFDFAAKIFQETLQME